MTYSSQMKNPINPTIDDKFNFKIYQAYQYGNLIVN